MIADVTERITIPVVVGAATAACVCAGYVMWRLGLFSALAVKEAVVGPYLVLYREITASFKPSLLALLVFAWGTACMLSAWHYPHWLLSGAALQQGPSTSSMISSCRPELFCEHNRMMMSA